MRKLFTIYWREWHKWAYEHIHKIHLEKRSVSDKSQQYAVAAAAATKETINAPAPDQIILTDR